MATNGVQNNKSHLVLDEVVRVNTGRYLDVLFYLIRRLGKQCTREIWSRAFSNYDDSEYLKLLLSDWSELDAEKQSGWDLEELVSKYFPKSVEGIDRDEAFDIIDQSPPIKQIRSNFENFALTRKVTRYDRLYIEDHGFSTLMEALVEIHGKQGEFIAYDMHKKVCGRKNDQNKDIAEFIKHFTSGPSDSSGTDYDVLKQAEDEAIIRITQCEWARYYNHHHPNVGYLLGCSMDETCYNAYNENIKMQRTKTIMEGDAYCDFRLYVDK